MDISTNITTTTEVKINQEELFTIIKNHLNSIGVKNIDKHVTININKEVVSGYDEFELNVTIKSYQ